MVERWSRWFWIGLILAIITGPAQAKVNDPTLAVQETADVTLQQLRLNKARLEAHPGEIYNLVEKHVLPRFDFDLISRYVLGRYWKQATGEEQLAFVEQFRNLMVRTYAHALLNYSDQSFRFEPARMDADPKRATVTMVVSQKGAPDIPIDYRLYMDGGGDWKVYDVVIDGLSLVSNYRTSFSSHIKRMGISGLTSWLAERNAESKE